MKHRILYIRWLVAALMLSTLPAMAEVRDTVDFDFVERTFEHITVDGETFIRYSFPDCDHIDLIGAPMLPVKYIRLSVPYNATNITVRPLASWTPANENKRIYPAPVPIPTDGSVTEEPGMVIDSTIYMTDAYWPPSAAELVGDGYYMGENRIVTIAVYPMLYNPVQNKMHNYTQVRVKVSYDPGPTPAGMLVRYNPQLRQQERQQAMALVSNPELVEAHAVPAATVQHMMQQNPDTTNWPVPGYEYMVITTRELAPAFKRLIALKQQKGYRAGVVCVEDIVNDPLVQNGDSCILADGTPGFINDDAGKIRQYLKLNWSYGTKFVFFGGNVKKGLPFRYTYGTWNSKDAVPSDTYYSDLSVKWSLFNDTIATYNAPANPYEPELFVGRIIPQLKEEVSNYTDKVFKYELNPGNGQTSYLKSALYTQCERMQILYNQAWIAARQLIDIFPDSVIFEEWNITYPTGSDLINLINNHHFGYINLHTHASPGCLVINTYPIGRSVNNWGGENQPYVVFSQTQYNTHKEYEVSEDGNCIDSLNVANYPNVVYSLSCTSMPYDYPNDKFLLYNIGSALTLLKETGCVAFMGNTRNGLIEKSFFIEQNFQSNLLKGFYKLGQAEALSKNTTSIHCNLAHNLMGDPELEIWTDEPQNFSSLSISREDNCINISNLSAGNYTYVGISDGQTQRMDSTLTGSITFNDVNPNSTTMVYKHNYLPYIAPLYLQNERVERSQYVIANEVYAGRNVDTNRTAGDLTIAEGSEYEIETKGQVVLAPGFKVEKGALFSVIRSDY